MTPKPPAGVTSPLAWFDAFAGPSLNAGLWTPGVAAGYQGGLWNTAGLPSGCSAVSSKGGDMTSYCDPAEVVFLEGAGLNLYLSASEVPGWQWAAGYLTSKKPANVLSVWAQLSSADFLWNAIWAMPSGNTSVGEIDFEQGMLWIPGLENKVPSNKIIATTYHAPSLPGGQNQVGVQLGLDLSLAVHRYDIIVTPGVSVETRIDGTRIGYWTEPVPAGPYQVLIGNQVAAPSTSNWHAVGTPVPPAPMYVQAAAAW